MLIQPHDLSDLICGTLRLIEPTAERDATHRVIWKTECICGQFEYGSSVQLAKFAGHSECPGHPFEGKEKTVEGFRLHPDKKDEPGHAAAITAWESRRHPEQSKVEADKLPSTGESKVLRDRLGLIGYRTETISLAQPVDMVGGKAEKVTFARQLDGEDRIFLHVSLVNADGKRSIVSSRKKVPDTEWTALTEALSEMQIVWREKESKRRKPA